MKSSVSGGSTREPRHLSNVQLGLVFGALAVALFLLALWKFRPS